VSVPLVVYGGYDVFWWLDELAHLSGGVVVALALDALSHEGPTRFSRKGLTTASASPASSR
jgi:hypothetical protein